jgi:putative membrane protein
VNPDPSRGSPLVVPGEPPVAGVLDIGEWHRLHPLSPLIRAGRVLVGLLAVIAGTMFQGAQEGRMGIIGRLPFLGMVIVFGVVSWLATRWRIEDGDLRIETGVIRRQSLRFPLTQIQAIDIVRPALARVLGLSELRLRMGGSGGGAGRLAYLTAGEAERVRAQLLALSRGASPLPAEDAGAVSDRVLTSVPVGRLVGSILVSGMAIVVLVLFVALVVAEVVVPAAVVPIISSSGAIGIGLLTVLWRRLNSGYKLTVAESPHGLRLWSGLLDTSAETIPSGRIQGVQMVEPLLWRPLGWVRLEVDVAGRHRREGENAAEGRQLRALLPVGTRDQADRLLGYILPGAPSERNPAPARARVKSPLRYHNLSWGRNQRYAVTTTGRLARVTSWIPVGKLQSLRLVQGPIQRRLRLATIHLDTAGRSLHAAIRDRDSDEAHQVLQELTDLARAARQGDRTGRKPEDRAQNIL